MKIKVTANPITMYGSFSRGQILTDEKFPTAFLIHLVDEAGAAEYIDKNAYLTKVNDEVEIKKKAPSSPSSQPAKVSKKKTSKKRGKKQP